MAKTYLHGKPIEGVVEVHEHISPVSTYVKVLAALFVLTAITYAVSFANLGSASLTVALFVAFIKASLVCMFFMHLKYDDRYHVFVFLSTIIFVSIFFTFTLFDLKSRPRLNEEQDTFFRIHNGGPADQTYWNDAQRATNHDKYPPVLEAKGEGAVEAKTEGKADAKADGKADAKADAKANAKAP